MRLIATCLLTILAVVGAAGPPASADTPRCVSRHEYQRIAQGMAMAKVHKIFDTPGVQTGLGAPNELRYYETCTGRGVIQVVFTPRGRMISKDGRFF